MLLPGRNEAADQQLEESVSGPECGAAMGTESDLELVAQEQVLNHQLLPLAEEPGHGGEEYPD
jgi:hypothetical protein